MFFFKPFDNCLYSPIIGWIILFSGISFVICISIWSIFAVVFCLMYLSPMRTEFVSKSLINFNVSCVLFVSYTILFWSFINYNSLFIINDFLYFILANYLITVLNVIYLQLCLTYIFWFIWNNSGINVFVLVDRLSQIVCEQNVWPNCVWPNCVWPKCVLDCVPWYPQGSCVAVLMSLLRQMTEFHYKSYIADFATKMDLQVGQIYTADPPENCQLNVKKLPKT